jgi:RimJ/RimL family protein N-acetyltransferase
MFLYKKIILRKLDSRDLAHCLTLREETWLNTHNVMIANFENQSAWFESLQKNDIHAPKNLLLMAIFPPYGSDSPIERLGILKILNIDYINQTAELGWDIFKEFRGKGWGKVIVGAGLAFCFDILGMRRVNAEILSTNIPSYKCAIKAGFVEEGIKRQAVRKYDEYIDSLVMGALASERKDLTRIQPY